MQGISGWPHSSCRSRSLFASTIFNASRRKRNIDQLQRPFIFACGSSRASPFRRAWAGFFQFSSYTYHGPTPDAALQSRLIASLPAVPRLRKIADVSRFNQRFRSIFWRVLQPSRFEPRHLITGMETPGAISRDGDGALRRKCYCRATGVRRPTHWPAIRRSFGAGWAVSLTPLLGQDHRSVGAG